MQAGEGASSGAGERRGPGRAFIAAFTVLAAVSVLVAACGTTDEASRQTLPPLVTTTTTTSTTSTIPENERFYEVQPGDILTIIAAQRGVTVQAIVELNGLDSEDDIKAGQVLEIPPNARK